MAKSVNFSVILNGKNTRETKLRPMDTFMKRGKKKTSQTRVKTIMMIQRNPHQRRERREFLSLDNSPKKRRRRKLRKNYL